MAALLLDIAPGDEVIMPSFTFVSTANAFVLRGAVPVFVDIRPDTLNLDERLIEAAITPRTQAIVAGALRRRRLRDGRDPGDRASATACSSIEDAAQGILGQLPRPPARLDRRIWRRCQLPRDEERHLAARAARC